MSASPSTTLRVRATVRGALLSTGLLLARRPALFLVLDGSALFALLIVALLGGGDPRLIWSWLVVAPTVFLGAPLMSDVVALERRAGTLDLALTSPGGHLYFERRLASVAAFLMLQHAVVVLITWALAPRHSEFSLIAGLVQAALLLALTCAIVLFWAVRLKSTGATAFASVLTLVLLSPWTNSPPEPTKALTFVAAWKPWSVSLLVVALTTLVAYLHARRRLRRPETLVA